MIIIFSHILLFLIAYYLGKNFAINGIFFPSFLFYAAVMIFLAIAICYPSRRRKMRIERASYAWRKTCDFLLVACSFLMFLWLWNADAMQSASFEIVPKSFASHLTSEPREKPTAGEILRSIARDGKRELNKEEKKILKKEFRKQIRIYVKQKLTGKNKEADETLLIVLAIIGALGLLLLVASLACSLSCSGADGAAIIVGIAGVIGVIWLLVFVIKRITHRKQPAKEPLKNQS